MTKFVTTCRRWQQSARNLPPELSRALGALERQLYDLGGTSYEAHNKHKNGEAEVGDVRPLAVLNAVTELRRIADDCERDAVRQARPDFSWEEIARALGVSKQSAHERLRHLDPQATKVRASPTTSLR